MRALAAMGLAVAILGAAVAYYHFGLTYRHRYELTLELEVGGRRHVASGVIEVTYRPDLVPGRPFPHYVPVVTGEALHVDLGPRGNLFALLVGPDRSSPYLLHERIFDLRRGGGSQAEMHDRVVALANSGAAAEVPFDKLPMLATFKDLDQPASVRMVEPDDLSPAFGADAKLVRATIRMTNDQVSSGITRTLPWLPALEARGGAFDGTRFARVGEPLASSLGPMSIRRGTP